MELSILKHTGEDTGRKVSLSDAIFDIEPNDHAIYLDVKQKMANARQGTHKSKERAEISGSTRKIKKQKGTGTARAGSIKSPIFKGGGRVFGPRPKDYSFKLNKKLKAVARKSALTYKAKDQMISVLEGFTFNEVKTKNYTDMLNKLSLDSKKTLLVLPEVDKNIVLSGRNIKNTQVTTVDSLNTYDVLHADQLLFVEGSLEKIENLFK
ncbi:50S ribosomal protein L4 [Marivirga tractuosa]|jgi:large subunit ribosomal protein L4|uniref:Large ribosomal subunit protein uL4 n=1 Tax=Marivirga tractuosa (strain ATCC 23168 / DSM 4126 / NBRC 15989 / NCIMB 1408 / VKM B-1430 / H-43) TaxID=643867 RepID=E4TTY7_MARTH|nr:50S ribosomal protein L4 [Marivirga tractuosa]ADR23009.1 LSU ribosomal protein L4P [Marivirga tractuosa DSM 4126]RUA33163.1 MAG: 50S ribosomal protein L4 [Bacteroidota bacterium]BDD16317.1 50S ribosomal protein L4 [Marivirga tractuosa]